MSAPGDRWCRGIGKEQAEHPADMVNHKRNTRFTGFFAQTVCQHIRQFGQALMHTRLGDFM